MCGRYAASADPETLVEEYRIDEVSEDGREACAPRYNIAPTDVVPAVVERDGDVLNEYAVVRPTYGLVAGTESFDRTVVDGLVMGSATMAGGLGTWLRRAQNGYVRTYGLTFVIGVVAIAAVVVFGQLV